jgi:antirestriction protein ArdC
MINFKTKQEYTNTNAEILANSGYESPYWMTFKQALELGMVVIKGESGTELKRVVIKKVKNKETGEIEEKKLLKRFYVFNLEQIKKRETTEGEEA